MEHGLDEKVAVITGAARGVDAFIAEKFAGARATVFVCDISDESGTATAE